jgi:hypothetical protein
LNKYEKFCSNGKSNLMIKTTLKSSNITDMRERRFRKSRDMIKHRYRHIRIKDDIKFTAVDADDAECQKRHERQD